MMLIFIYHFLKIIVESMYENFVASEIHQLVPMSCFDLNEWEMLTSVVRLW